MVPLFNPAWCLLGVLAAGATVSDPSPVRKLYFTARDSSGKAVQGLKTADLLLFEKGLPQTLLDLKEAPEQQEEDPAGLRRLFVIYFDDGLTERERFRARRWLLRALTDLSPNDAVAVYRAPRLSAFKTRRSARNNLIRYFGTELFLGLPVGSSYSPSPLALHPDRFTCRNPPGSATAGRELDFLYDQGAEGDLLTVVGALRDLPGRKILLYFGSRLDPLSSPLKLAGQTAGRLLDDAGVSLYVIPSDEEDPVPDALAELARETGGDLLGRISTLETTLPKLLQATSRYYCATYASSLPPDGRFRTLALSARRGSFRIQHQQGYFSTVAGAHGVAGRTFLTVLRRPEQYSDFPFLLRLTPVRETPGGQAGTFLKISLIVPLDELFPARPPAERGSTARSLSQGLQMLALAFGPQGQVSCAWTRQYQIQIDAGQAGLGTGQQGLLEESLAISPANPVESLRVVLIAGLNERISTRIRKF